MNRYLPKLARIGFVIVFLTIMPMQSAFAYVCEELKCAHPCNKEHEINYTDSNGVTYKFDNRKTKAGDTIQTVYDGVVRYVIRTGNPCNFLIIELSGEKFSYYLETKKIYETEYIKSLPKEHYKILLFFLENCAVKEKQDEESLRRFFEDCIDSHPAHWRCID